MAEFTNIEWCDATLSLWWGCTKVSDGCKHCYAEDLSDHRYKKGAWGPGGTRVEIKSWRSTLKKIRNRADAEDRRLKVFCQSMSDTFEGASTMGGVKSDNWKMVSDLQDELFGEVIPSCPELDFLALTKRPENILSVLHRHDDPQDYSDAGCYKPMPNLWLGTSVEDQKTANERITQLCSVEAAVRFLSVEPLLGQVDLDIMSTDELTGCADDHPFRLGMIHWVIVGGESGPKARHMDVEWARAIRDQCAMARVPFFMKQMGGTRKPFEPIPDDLMIRQMPQIGGLA